VQVTDEQPSQPSTTPPALAGPGSKSSKSARSSWGRGLGRFGSLELLAAVLIVVILARGPIVAALSGPGIQSWTTVFVSVLVQALPFLVFGVLLSAVIAVFVPASFFARALPKRPAIAVPVAGAAGVVLPGCECASVPVAAAMVRRGITPAAALTFLLASPAINPIVLASTVVAFPGEPMMVVARTVASLITAVAMGWLWLRLGRSEWIRLPSRPEIDQTARWPAFWASLRHDVLHAGGFLVIGAMAAATIQVVVPGAWIQAVADQPLLSIAVLAVLAVLLSICSEADAFVAASLREFSLTARLTFLVVGPMVDLKLFAMQVGIFGRRFAVRFAPTTLLVAVAVSALTGWILL